jgi:hypothetical protein
MGQSLRGRSVLEKKRRATGMDRCTRFGFFIESEIGGENEKRARQK